MGMDGCNTSLLADTRGEGWRFADRDFPAASNPYPKSGALYVAWAAGWRAKVDGKTYSETVNQTMDAPMNTVLINIDGRDVAVAPGIDVLNIKAAAGIHGVYQLVQERLGQPDFQMSDSHVPELKGGEVFYSIPPTNGG